jgi:hypothetical protein
MVTKPSTETVASSKFPQILFGLMVIIGMICAKYR